MRGTPAGPHTQKAPVHKVNSRKQQLFRGKIWMQQNVPIVMDSWVLTNVTTTTIKIQNLLKKKKKKVQNISLAPENSLLHCTVTPRTPAPGNLWSTFCCRLILSFPEFYNNEIVQHAFVFLLSSLSAIFRDSSGGCTAEFFWFCFCCCEIWIHPSLSLVDGYLGGFQFGDFMSTSAVKICAQAMSGHMLSFLLSKYLEI